MPISSKETKLNVDAQLLTFPYQMTSKLFLSSNCLMAISHSQIYHSKATWTNKKGER